MASGCECPVSCTFDGHAHYLVLPSPVAPALLSLLTLEDTKLKLCPGWTVEDKVACSFSNFAGLARASKTRDRFLPESKPISRVRNEARGGPYCRSVCVSWCYVWRSTPPRRTTKSVAKIGARLIRVLPRSMHRATAVGREGRRSGAASDRAARRKRAVRARTSRGEISRGGQKQNGTPAPPHLHIYDPHSCPPF